VDASGSYAEKLSSKNMVLSLASNGGNPSIAKLIANLGANRDLTKDLAEWIDSIICKPLFFFLFCFFFSSWRWS
jgi:hypothetical protein